MYVGIGASMGAASGKLCFCKESLRTYKKCNIKNVTIEKEYVKSAYINVEKELLSLYELAKERVGQSVAMIVQGHCLMIQDQGCYEQILALIEEQMGNAEWAIQEVFQKYIQTMNQSEDAYLKARTADLREILNRLEYAVERVKRMGQSKNLGDNLNEPFIAIGKDFSVEDILILYTKGAQGILDLNGDEESHALVVAKSLGLPMIIHLTEECRNAVGHFGWMDGASGSVQVE